MLDLKAKEREINQKIQEQTIEYQKTSHYIQTIEREITLLNGELRLIKELIEAEAKASAEQ